MSTPKRIIWCYLITDHATGQVLVQYVPVPQPKKAQP
jgi:hypothetical protein